MEVGNGEARLASKGRAGPTRIETKQKSAAETATVCHDDSAPPVVALMIDELHSLPKKKSAPNTPNVDQDDLNPHLQRLPSIQQRATQSLIGTVANLANRLPTGTLIAFQLLMPVFTQNGSCDSATRAMTFVLLALLALSCFLASFTDSVNASDGQVYYGFATSKGLWLYDCPDLIFKATEAADVNKKREFRDWLHAVLSVLVFGAVALRDRNVVQCYYPTPGKETLEVLNIVPIGIGLICSLLFTAIPTTRHGIGYHVTRGK